MSPTFIDNKTVISLQKFSGTLQKKHVYLYKVQETILLHRYIKTKQQTHIFRGDNCSNNEYVDIESIIGEVIHVDQKPFAVSWKTKSYLKRKQLKQLIKKILRG